MENVVWFGVEGRLTRIHYTNLVFIGSMSCLRSMKDLVGYKKKSGVLVWEVVIEKATTNGMVNSYLVGVYLT